MSTTDDLGSATRRMALGTVASRGTGFLRTATIAAVLGVLGVGDAYNVANTTPNIVYELLLGGILTSVVVPLLVQAARDDGDEGQAYAQRLLTVTVLGLGLAALALVVLAPQLVALYAGGMSRREEQLAVVFARFFLPQVLFYGAGAVMGAILNTRNRFTPPMWAPVLNNLVVIATGVVFVLLPRPAPGGPLLTAGQITVMGLGTTLGIVAQTVALLPSLRASGFRLRLRRDLRGVGLARAGRLASWVLLYVVISQVGFAVVVRLATDRGQVAAGRGFTSYLNAYVLWQLPHAIVAVSVITALLPRLSRAAAEDRLLDLRRTLNRGLRLTTSLLVPAAVGYVVLGRGIATLVFAHGQVTVPQARFIGELLGVFALGLVPYSLYQLQLRAFYALQDTRTPMWINLGVTGTMVAVDLALYAVLGPGQRSLGLAAGHAASFAVGLVLASRILSRRVGGLGMARVTRCAVRCTLAALLPGLAAAWVVAVIGRWLGSGPAGSGLGLLVGGAVLGAGYLAGARRLRVRELDEALGPVLARLPGRSSPAPRPPRTHLPA